jgi:hypothetical protein
LKCVFTYEIYEENADKLKPNFLSGEIQLFAPSLKYKLGNDYFCDDKTISHFKEIAKRCREESFDLIEEL